MGWDGSGNIVRTNGTNTGGTVWQDDANAGVKIRADRHDTHDQDLADAIEQALNRNGENSPSANIDWGANRITNLGNGSAADDAATLGQVQSQIAGVASASGTDALTASFSPALTALTDETTVYVRAAAANTSTTPTFKPNSLTAKTITKEGNQALVAGDIAGADHVIILQYNASNDVWEILNPAAPEVQPNFPNVDADVTATDEELNKSDGITGQILTSGNDGPVYTGRVDVSSPAINNGPSGWSVSKTATGRYLINHSLGLSNVKNLQVSGNTYTNSAFVQYTTAGGTDSNNAEIRIARASDATLIDEDFGLIIINTEET